MSIAAEGGPGLVAITSGEPAGIGPDLILAAWSLKHSVAVPPLIEV